MCFVNWVSRKIVLVTVFFECLKWRDSGVDAEHQARKGCGDSQAAASQCKNI